MNADGTGRHEIGAVLDARQGPPHWSPDGSAVYFTAQERGSIHLVPLPLLGGKPEYVVNDIGSVGGWSVGKDGTLAYGFAAAHDPLNLFPQAGGRRHHQRPAVVAPAADLRGSFIWRAPDGKAPDSGGGLLEFAGKAGGAA